MLDEVYGLLKESRNMNKEIGNEIKNQKPLLNNLDNQIDTVGNKMKRAQNRLNQWVDKSSTSCYMTFICLEIILLLIVVLAL